MLTVMTNNDFLSLNSAVGRGRPSRALVFKQFASATNNLSNYGGLPTPHEAKEIWDDIWYLEAHNSTAIEGNTLVLREVKALLDEGRSVGGKALKEYLEVEGYGGAARWIYSQANSKKYESPQAITITEVRHIHELLVKNVWSIYPHPNALPGEKAGSFRQHNIQSFTGGMTPPPWTDVAPQMSDWIKAAVFFASIVGSKKIPQEDVPFYIAQLHSRFERIHPFLDGNGITGRLAVNLLLVRLGFPPAIVLKQHRISYLRALEKSDSGNHLPLAEMIARSVIHNINRFVVPAIAGPVKLVPIRALESRDISYAALRQAATRGKLEAQIGADGNWYSSKTALNRYLARKYRRD